MFCLRLVFRKLLKHSFKPPLLIFGMSPNYPSVHTYMYGDNKESAAFSLLVWPTTQFNPKVSRKHLSKCVEHCLLVDPNRK